MWRFDRLLLSSAALAAVLGIAVARNWRAVQMLAGLAIVVAVPFAAFSAFIESLPRRWAASVTQLGKWLSRKT